jgi:hypothetical protein
MVRARDLRRQNERGPDPAENHRAERQEETARMLGEQIAARYPDWPALLSDLDDWGSAPFSPPT